LFVAVIWFLSTLLYRLKTNRITVITAALVVLTLMAFTTRRQVEFWQNNFTLYEHAIAVTENNPLAHNNLGNAYLRRGQMNEAIEQYRECLRINPWYSLARQNLAAVMKLREQDDFKVISPR
jgi:tetratricopeptide (TPR) repeat protein